MSVCQLSLLPDSLWMQVKDGDRTCLELYNRHYSARTYRDGRHRTLFCGPGEKIVLLSHDYAALFVWRKFMSMAQQQGINCAIFRNEGTALSSTLILAAEKYAVARWPGERLYTYVNPKRIRSVNPGHCFKVAGWQVCGTSKGGLIILEKLPPNAGRPEYAEIRVGATS